MLAVSVGQGARQVFSGTRSKIPPGFLPLELSASRPSWAPALPLHPSKILSGPCYKLKSNFNNGLPPESTFYRLVNTKAYYKTIMLTNQQAIIVALHAVAVHGAYCIRASVPRSRPSLGSRASATPLKNFVWPLLLA